MSGRRNSGFHIASRDGRYAPGPSPYKCDPVTSETDLNLDELRASRFESVPSDSPGSNPSTFLVMPWRLLATAGYRRVRAAEHQNAWYAVCIANSRRARRLGRGWLEMTGHEVCAAAGYVARAPARARPLYASAFF
jgi:hypothetical protein